ncbi:MAG: SdpI family protein [Labilithrix sp.]|nr:SdpI family protein [Labilithrix sp.]MCW5812606.1 SdpI family protein [Labilithrix sp.]
MKVNRTQLLSLGLVVLAFVLAAVLYPRLPESVPTHWNVKGEADGFTPKPWGPFVLPLVMAGVHALLVVLPRISPRGYRIDRFRGTFEIIQASVVAFLFLVSLLVLLAGIGAAVPMNRAIHAGAGLLFVVLGNFMGKLTKNFFVGIRTPWTLASDEVWLRTHRLGGKLFVLAGVVLVVSGLLGGGAIPMLVAIALACGVPAVYSYVAYRRIEDVKNTSHGET